MRFDVRKSDALRTFRKKDKKSQTVDTYLIDEILSRTMKTHYERVYCSRFMRPIVDVVGLSVRIEVTDNIQYSLLRQITFRLQESGYPDVDARDIYKLCPDLAEWDGNGRFDGSHLARKRRCQSNGGSSTSSATAVSREAIYAARARHSAKATERLCL